MSLKSKLSRNELPKADTVKSESLNNDLEEVSDLYVNKRNGGLKKWLPAIIFALLLHIALLILFLLGDYKLTKGVDDTNLSAIEKKTIDANLDDFESIEPSSMTVNNSQKEIANNKESSANTDNSKGLNLSNNSLSNQNNRSNNLTINQDRTITVEEKQFKPSPTNQDILDHVTNQVATIDMEPLNVGSINPNDAVLLSRDLPSSKSNKNVVDDEYTKKAQQIEEINSKISDAIKEVKQKNMDNIESHRQQLEMLQNESKHKNIAGKIIVSEKGKTDRNAYAEKTVEPKKLSANDKLDKPNNTAISPLEPSPQSDSEPKNQVKMDAEQEAREPNNMNQNTNDMNQNSN